MRLFFALFLCALTATAHATPERFSQSKRILSQLYRGPLDARTLYCHCPFGVEDGKLVPDLAACGYEVRKQPRRAGRIEWEHVMPAWQFGHQRQCWQQGGRSQCQKDPDFRRMEADLHNLYPAIGEVNGDRSNYRFTVWGETPSQYGRCEMLVDFKGRRAQPPLASRGAIARAYLYMTEHYGLTLSDGQEKLYRAWHTMYPADAAECRRHLRVAEHQGWPNPYLAQQCDE